MKKAKQSDDVYIRSNGDYPPNRHYSSCVIVTTRSGEPFSSGDSPFGQGLATIANFLYSVDDDPTAPYEAWPVKIQTPQVREFGGHFICMRCRPGSTDWERLPRIGFDAPLADCDLTAEQLAARPPEAQGVVTVRDMLLTEAGRRWWHSVGPLFPLLYFDVVDGSEACGIIAQMPAEQGVMAALESNEWQHPIGRPRISGAQREAEIARLLHWSALWHDHLVETYIRAEDADYAERIAAIGQDEDDM